MARGGPIPRCSECKKQLVNEDGSRKPAGTKTCSEKCKSARARRTKRNRQRSSQNAAYSPHEKAAAEVIAGEVRDVAREVVKEELAPVVREQLTADVLRSIQDLIQDHMPEAITVLAKQMQSEDETIAQRAATLIAKYTLGNPSVAPPPSTPQQGGLSVVFNVPRPGDAIAPEVDDVVSVAAEALRECSDCSQSKGESEFVAGSDRCQACFDGMRGMLVERFGDVYKP